ncbi:NAD(P)-dependent oxidoreductase [Leifsonia sp. Leaf264]|uniref:NAD(P)-dependent oxidoreductase n=1 Tax=Leifsonia sp. Leaf264 TaxID=1736314 RepID=UPI0006F82012|nr:NAD(P)H-binding protein [Leifsonia sp. Leaf264]KQO95705.1 NAD-dependent epimerase [Leifsonia sp. Leaf264]
MTRIGVIGGTGYTGSNIVHEAASRGHTVVSVARRPSDHRAPGAIYLEGSILDAPDLVESIEGVEVVVFAVAPRGDMAGNVRSAIAEIVRELPGHVRIGVIGGTGGSLVEPGGPRVVDVDFPEAYKAESLELIGVLDDLEASPTSCDWFYVHPAAGYGGMAPGERTGSYRVGGDVMLVQEDGESFISGADLAMAIVDEIESPRHRRERFTLGY